MKTVTFAKPINTTAKKPSAKVDSTGKALSPARTGVSDEQIASLLAKYGKPWKANAA